MAHAIIEYSANIEDRLKLDELIEKIHNAAINSGVFPIGGMRTRAARRDHYRIADGHPDNGFVHVLMKLGPGRDVATKKKAQDFIFAAIDEHLLPLVKKCPLAVSFEMVELPENRINQNNIHDYLKARKDAG
ncbi:MAG: 5-carboxymethyl-2-hydroxymuconate isomerase [Rhodospirillales bacterium]|nr:5-carboxymethyl-2-hydroxymuconate isomerase [Rhodospirillales bacterium]